MSSPAAPKGLRNGLIWRNGRPRWEPSPASRKAGLKGRDLKGADGGWMDRGSAISAADKRALWATLIREALTSGLAGEEARADLRLALENLPHLVDATDRHARLLMSDLIDAAQNLIQGLDSVEGIRLTGGPRTVQAMVDGYFSDSKVKIAASTRRAYRTQADYRILPKFSARKVDSVTRGELRNWYVELVEMNSIPTANLCLGALGAFFKWAGWQDWISHSPVTKLGMLKPDGRRVYWTMEEENNFVAWCDANGYQDIADGVTACLWTAARISDVCAANLPDLAGDTWRFVPQKTKRSKLEALPALLPVVKARVERHKSAVVGSLERAFLLSPATGNRHTTKSFYERYIDAKARALAADAVPMSFMGKRVQDTRDTCVTRLADADVSFMKIWPWTGHSPKDVETILRNHYIVLREEGARETAIKLEAWAEANRFSLNA